MNNIRRMVMSVAVAAVVGSALVASGITTQAHAAGFRYQQGWYTANGTWLCYGSNGYWQCSQHWQQLRDKINGAPAPKASTPPPAPATSGCRAAGVPAIGGVSGGMHYAPGGIPNDSCYAVQSAPYGGHLSLWLLPPAPYNRVYYVNPALYPSRPSWPVCSWWAHAVDGEYPAYWGYHNHYNTPAVGATIRYMPGVLGAGSGGHVGHVVAVYSNGWVLSSEMNFYVHGGGPGRVIFRFVPAWTHGVEFWY